MKRSTKARKKLKKQKAKKKTFRWVKVNPNDIELNRRLRLLAGGECERGSRLLSYPDCRPGTGGLRGLFT